MRETTLQFENSLKDEVSSLCRLWVLTIEPTAADFAFALENSLPAPEPEYLYYSDSDTDITAELPEGRVTFPVTEGFESSAVSLELGSPVGGYVVSIPTKLSSAEGISILELSQGRYDGVNTRLYAFDRSQGDPRSILLIHTGVIGDLDYTNESRVEVTVVNGTEAKSTEVEVEYYSKQCRASFCDTRCTLDKNDFRWPFINTVANDRITITDNTGLRDNLPAGSLGNGSGKNFFDSGVVEMTTGKNKGITREILRQEDNGIIILWTPFPYDNVVGDRGYAYQGCDKLFQTCRSYGNHLNFRGEPFRFDIPSLGDPEVPTPDTKQSLSEGGGEGEGEGSSSYYLFTKCTKDISRNELQRLQRDYAFEHIYDNNNKFTGCYGFWTEEMAAADDKKTRDQVQANIDLRAELHAKYPDIYPIP